jgi:hypothetical protein
VEAQAEEGEEEACEKVMEGAGVGSVFVHTSMKLYLYIENNKRSRTRLRSIYYASSLTNLRR